MEIENFSYSDLSKIFPSVSRETYERLNLYVQMIVKWQKTINLISPQTLSTIWQRHIVDSYQAVGVLTSGDVILDLGAGAGLPGIVHSIAGFDVTMVESDKRKSAFLREVVRELGLQAKVENTRAEDIQIDQYQVITARAFTDILSLLRLLENKITSQHIFLLFKGKSFAHECEEAKQFFAMDCQIIPSITEPEAALLKLTNVTSLNGVPGHG